MISFFKTSKIWDKYSSYFKSSFLYLFSSFFPAAINILINPLMAKNLSPEDYAILGYFSSFNTIIIPILNFSLISYYLRNYYLITKERRPIVKETILVALTVYGFIALVIVFVIYFLYWKYTNISFPYYPFAILAFTPNLFNNIFRLFQVDCRLNREAGKYTKVTVAKTLLNIIGAIILVIIYKFGATGKLLSPLLGSIIIFIYCFIKLKENCRFDWDVIKAAFKFGWPLSLSAILWYFFNGVDKAFLERLNDTYTFGYYNVGVQISGYFAMFYTAIAQTFEPDIYKAIAANRKRKLLKIIGGITFLNAIPNILFIIFAVPIIGLLTYNRYIESSGFAQILSLKNITLSLYYSTIIIVVGYGYSKAQLIIIIIGSCISIVIYKIMIENNGFYGAAWGQVFSFLILAFIVILFLFFKLKFHKNEMKDGIEDQLLPKH